jgi:hypothetical protein
MINGTINAKEEINTNNMKYLPILHEGRIKPLDTFSKSNLMNIHEKYTYKNINSINWLSEVIFNPYKSYEKEIFFINENLKKILHLNKKQYYSFFEAFEIINKNINQINKLYKININNLTETQTSLINLHQKIMNYLNISQSLSMITYKFNIDQSIINILNLKNKKNFCYIDILEKKNELSYILKNISNKQLSTLTNIEKNILKISNEIYFLSKEKNNQESSRTPPRRRRRSRRSCR